MLRTAARRFVGTVSSHAPKPAELKSVVKPKDETKQAVNVIKAELEAAEKKQQEAEKESKAPIATKSFSEMFAPKNF